MMTLAEEEAEATRTTRCLHCGARPNEWCEAITRAGHPAPARHPHKPRMDMWRANQQAASGRPQREETSS
jgi:hypothetical protein